MDHLKDTKIKGIFQKLINRVFYEGEIIIFMPFN